MASRKEQWIGNLAIFLVWIGFSIFGGLKAPGWWSVPCWIGGVVLVVAMVCYAIFAYPHSNDQTQDNDQDEESE